jgi:hypothetical protein
MTKDDAIDAITKAAKEAVAGLYGPLVSGLRDKDEKPDALIARFRAGVSLHCDAHAKAKAVIEQYFTGGQ